MPDTFVGLVLFVLFIAPGICYTAVREARHPARELSSLRELASVLLAGVVCNLAAALFLALTLAIGRSLGATVGPIVGDFARAPGSYAATHFAQTAEWGLALFGIACALGLVLGATDFPKPQFLSGSIQFESAWYQQLHHPDKQLYCGCQLDDGSWVEGYLLSFNTDVEDTSDRDLVLTRPRYRPAGNEEAPTILQGTMIISGRRLTFLTVTELTVPSSG